MTLYSIEAEHGVLGAAMYAPQECAEAFERLRPSHFHDDIHGRIWEAVLQATRRGGMPDPVTVDGLIAAEPGYQALGGMGFLVQLVDKANTWTLTPYIDAIADRASRRAILGLAKDIEARAQDTGEGDADAVLAALERGAAEIAREGASRPHAKPVGLGALEMLEAARSGRFVGTPVGLACIDHVTGGIRQDDVWFIGGRTSMGKSVMGLCLARGIAEQGRGVLMFSLEMPEREVQARLIADIAFDLRIPENGEAGGNVRYGDVLKGRGNPDQWSRAEKAAKALASLPVMVNDQGGLSIEDIRSQALRQTRAWQKAGIQPGAILIDHIGLVKPAKSRGDSKAAETADVVNELKAIAKQVGAPVIALCQVNRNTESRQDKRPTLADLNWSGAIEQIADFICLLYRDAYYKERSSDEDEQMEARRCQNAIELLVHKNRSGPICKLDAFVSIASNVIRDLPERGRATA